MASFPAFYLTWGKIVEWDVPDFHLEAADWMEHRGRVGVLKMFRGASKSTLTGRYIPYKLFRNPRWRFLAMSATDLDASKLSSDARFVIERHPWTARLKNRNKGLWETRRFAVSGNDDPRNASVSAYGVTSNVTSSRADEAIFDDCEVPKTIATPQLRESLRAKMSETTHILVPGGKKLYIGTDHCEFSIYREQKERGADCLEIPLFAHEVEHKADGKQRDFVFGWRIQQTRELFVVVGGKALAPSEYEVHGVRDYKGGFIRLKQAPFIDTIVEIYAGNRWPKRFTQEEAKFKREECRTKNEWDSQYQLHAKKIADARLDPARINEYTGTPEIRAANNEVTLWLNGVRLTGVAAWWDCSLGKKKSDDSAFCVIFTDSQGFLYWHIAESLQGDINAQCRRIVEIVKELQIPGLCVETNGPGGFVPTILRGHLQRAGVQCAVSDRWSKTDKNLRILDAFEAPLSGMFLHARPEVLQVVRTQMEEWNPIVKNQPDDFLDAGAGAISETPVRIGQVVSEMRKVHTFHDWRSGSGTVDIESDY